MLSITFTQAAQALSDAQSIVSIGEAHGVLSGALCASELFPLQRWLDEVQPDDVELDVGAQQALRETLQSLHRDTARALRSQDMAFTPFLPDDDSPLANRTEALAQWCQGFLYGFGVVGGGPKRALPAQIDEVLRDVAQIARASAGESDPTEEDESDYVEIVEYLRAGVQLVYDEMHGAKPPVEELQ